MNWQAIAARARWMEFAACRGATDLFYPHEDDRRPGGLDRRHLANVARAKHICAGCPVQDECLRHAITTNEQHGIWGGMTARERWRFKRDGVRPAPIAYTPRPAAEPVVPIRRPVTALPAPTRPASPPLPVATPTPTNPRRTTPNTSATFRLARPRLNRGVRLRLTRRRDN